MKTITIGTAEVDKVEIGDDAGLFLIAGPCVIESRDLCFEIAEYLKKLTAKLIAWEKRTGVYEFGRSK